jgi:hypothetical protein
LIWRKQIAYASRAQPAGNIRSAMKERQGNALANTFSKTGMIGSLKRFSQSLSASTRTVGLLFAGMESPGG